MGGAGGALVVGKLGMVNFDACRQQQLRTIRRIVFRWRTAHWNHIQPGRLAILANRNYRDVVSMNGDGIPRKQLSAFTSLSLRRFGNSRHGLRGMWMPMLPRPRCRRLAPQPRIRMWSQPTIRCSSTTLLSMLPSSEIWIPAATAACRPASRSRWAEADLRLSRIVGRQRTGAGAKIRSASRRLGLSGLSLRRRRQS